MNYSQEQTNGVSKSTQQEPRALVQLGGCTRTVGAGAILSLLETGAAKQGLKGSVAAAGCDGACYEAPVIIIEGNAGLTFRLTNVRPADVNEILSNWLSGRANRSSQWRGSSPIWPIDGAKTPFWDKQNRIVMKHVGLNEPTDLPEYIARGGFKTLEHVLLNVTPDEFIEETLRANLRGRGGAYFPTAKKWQGARITNRHPRYLIVNGEEGEPGIYKDRHIMEGDPYLLIEGIALAAYAIGATKTYLYINGEAHLAARRMNEALEKACTKRFAGNNVLGTDFCLDIELRRGGGGYILGEESALMNSIEGQRNVPRTKPPFPVESGLWGQPTVINNVETLSNLAGLFHGNKKVPGESPSGIRETKLISLNGMVKRPGLIEVDMGTTIREIVYDIGGGPLEGHQIIGVVAGGPSGGLLNTSMLDIPIGPGMLDPEGAVLGSGGVTVLDESVSPVEVVRRLAKYNAAESCSKCTPCREGTHRIIEVMDKITSGKGKFSDFDQLSYLSEVVGYGSLCGLGQMAPGPVRSGMSHFKQAFTQCIKNPQ